MPLLKKTGFVLLEETMERVYCVKINGRTLESRNLKELLARAVSAKRNLDRGTTLRRQAYRQLPTERTYAQQGIAAAQ